MAPFDNDNTGRPFDRIDVILIAIAVLFALGAGLMALSVR